MLSCIIRRHYEKQICSPNRLQLPKYKQSISNTQDRRLMEFSEQEIFHETDPALLMKNNANSFIFFLRLTRLLN